MKRERVIDESENDVRVKKMVCLTNGQARGTMVNLMKQG